MSVDQDYADFAEEISAQFKLLPDGDPVRRASFERVVDVILAKMSKQDQDKLRKYARERKSYCESIEAERKMACIEGLKIIMGIRNVCAEIVLKDLALDVTSAETEELVSILNSNSSFN